MAISDLYKRKEWMKESRYLIACRCPSVRRTLGPLPKTQRNGKALADSHAWLDEDGKDAEGFASDHEIDPERDWWTCSKRTEKGDLALLWRSKRGSGLKSDIGYLIEARSDACLPPKGEIWGPKTWKYWCLFKSIYKFSNPVTIEDFRGVPCLENWGVYKVHFQRHFYEIPEEQWEMLNKIAGEKNPGYEDFLKATFQNPLDGEPTATISEVQRPILPSAKHISGSLSIEDFRIPEEREYFAKVKNHPANEKVERWVRKTLVPESPIPGSIQSFYKKVGVQITRQIRPDIFDAIKRTFNLFGHYHRQFEIFALRNAEEDQGQENAKVWFDNDQPIFVFFNHILKILDQKEIEAVIGHEIGHVLLDHGARYRELNNILEFIDEASQQKTWPREKDLHELGIYVHLLFQLQELSADRIGLLASQDLTASVVGLMKLHGGYFADNVTIDTYIKAAEELAERDVDDIEVYEDIIQSHPYGPMRAKALKLFSETDLYKHFIGQETGESISDFGKYLVDIIPFPPEDLVKISETSTPAPNIDDCILELFFYSYFASVDGKFSPAEEKTIERFLPVAVRDEVIQKWSDLNTDWESKPEEYTNKVAEEYRAKASKKGSNWKTRFIKRMITIVKADRRILDEELEAIAAIAEKVDAQEACSKQFVREFGYDPFSSG